MQVAVYRSNCELCVNTLFKLALFLLMESTLQNTALENLALLFFISYASLLEIVMKKFRRQRNCGRNLTWQWLWRTLNEFIVYHVKFCLRFLPPSLWNVSGYRRFYCLISVSILKDRYALRTCTYRRIWLRVLIEQCIYNGANTVKIWKRSKYRISIRRIND